MSDTYYCNDVAVMGMKETPAHFYEASHMGGRLGGSFLVCLLARELGRPCVGPQGSATSPE